MKAKSEGTAKRSEKVSAGSKKATAKKEVKKVVKETAAPSEAEIRKKAEEIYKERVAKNIPGTQECDWLKAEKLLKGLK